MRICSVIRLDRVSRQTWQNGIVLQMEMLAQSCLQGQRPKAEGNSESARAAKTGCVDFVISLIYWLLKISQSTSPVCTVGEGFDSYP